MSNYETQIVAGITVIDVSFSGTSFDNNVTIFQLSVYNASSRNLSPEYDPIKDRDYDSEYGQWEVHDEANRAPNGSPEIHHIAYLWFLRIFLPDIHPTGT